MVLTLLWERSRKKQNGSNVLAAMGSTVITCHHPTDHDRTLLRLQLHWLWGLRSSQNHRITELTWTSSVSHLETNSAFKVIQNVCLLHGYDKRGDGLVTLVQKKRKSSNRKAQYGISYPTHLTRLEEQMKTLPYPPYIGMALKLCACRLFTPTTCSLLLPGLELNITFRPYKVCSFHSTSRPRFN